MNLVESGKELEKLLITQKNASTLCWAQAYESEEDPNKKALISEAFDECVYFYQIAEVLLQEPMKLSIALLKAALTEAHRLEAEFGDGSHSQRLLDFMQFNF